MIQTNKILRSRRIVCTFKTQKFENFDSLAPLARNYSQISIFFSLIREVRSYQSHVMCVTKTQVYYYCTDKICDWPTGYRDLKKLYTVEDAKCENVAYMVCDWNQVLNESKAVRRIFFQWGGGKIGCLVSEILRGSGATKPEGAKRPSGGRVWEGVSPPPTR